MKLFKKISLTISIGLISIIFGSNIANLAFAQESNNYSDTNEQIVKVKILPKKSEKENYLPVTGEKVEYLTIVLGLVTLFIPLYFYVAKDRRKIDK